VKAAVVILAGGEGSRIGGGKPLISLGGISLLDRALGRARGWSDHVAVAVRDPRQLGASKARTIDDEPDLEGPLAGLAAALRFGNESGAEAVLTLPVDMPFLPADLRERLEQSLAGVSAAIASSKGRLHPVCGLWRVSALDRLAAYLASGRRSLRGFAETIGFRAVEWLAEPDPFFNINTAQDLAEAERRLGADDARSGAHR
jgi:molybdopterin-guanine dinucleotide biosynthesis protein A